MGAQQIKSGNEKLVLRVDKRRYSIVQKSREDENSKSVEQNLISDIHVPTVMFKPNMPLVSPKKHNISVADFAKIKVEHLSVDENDQAKLNIIVETQEEPLKKKIKCELIDICNITEEALAEEGNIPEENIAALISPTTDTEKKIECPETHAFVTSLPAVEEEVDVTFPKASVVPIRICSFSESNNSVILTKPPKITEAESLNKNMKYEDTSNKSVAISEEDLLELNISLPKSTVYQCDVALQNNVLLPQSNNSNFECTKKIYYTMNENLENENHVDDTNDKNINHQLTNITKFVKNPFAFLRKKRSKVLLKDNNLHGNKNQENLSNNCLKSEPILVDIELQTESVLTDPLEIAIENEVVLKEEPKPLAINLNELIIKSEILTTSLSYQDVYKTTISDINSLSCNTDSSSLDVNLSNDDTVLEDDLSKQSIDDLTSIISINNTAESSNYFSIIDISSVENDEVPVPNSQLKETAISPRKLMPCLKNIQNVKKKEKRTTLNEKLLKSWERRRKTKRNRSNKYAEEDYLYKFKLPSGNHLKKLPATNIKTRKKINKLNDDKAKKSLKNLPKTTKKIRKKCNKPVGKKATCAKEDFPRPLKLEPSSSRKEHDAAIELPKPMMFKTESALNTKTKKSYEYLKPEFQPYVLLKRMKSEELLVPLKTKSVRKNRKFKSTTNIENRDLLIQRAYSLNTSTKLNRLSIDPDHYYCNQQCSLNNCLTSTNMPNESRNETESKYFSQQELYSLFHSSTPEASSLCRGNIDSGVSTLTPSTSHHSSNCNKTLLLQIAAERAFINNHLMHFGYSPMQFELYNNLNDLKVFLKYLFGNVNTN